MPRGTKTLVGNLMGSGSPVRNITSSIACYPTSNDNTQGLSVTSGTGYLNFGSWVEIIGSGGSSADVINNDFAILGFTIWTQNELDVSVNEAWSMGALQVGVGESGSESAVETIQLGRYYYSRDTRPILMPYLAYPRFIPGGSTVSLRMADYMVAAEPYLIKMAYCTNLRTGGQFTNGNVWNTKFYYSTLITSGSSSYSWGLYKEVVPQNSITSNFYIRGLWFECQGPANAWHIGIATGISGSETTIAEIPIAQDVMYYTIGGSIYKSEIPTYISFPIMCSVPALSRVSVRLSDNRSTANTYSPICLDVVKGSLFT